MICRYFIENSEEKYYNQIFFAGINMKIRKYRFYWDWDFMPDITL